jgi:hypothetical protein
MYSAADGSTLPGVIGIVGPQGESEADLAAVTSLPASGVSSPTAAAQPGCFNNGEYYANGADIVTANPCEHCYCLNGDVVCAIQECMGPLEGKTDNCEALPPPPGQCCPVEYKCSKYPLMYMYIYCIIQ